MRRLNKFLQLSWDEKILFLQSAMVLAISTLGLKAFPWFKIQGFLLKMAGRHSSPLASNRPTVQQIHWTIRASGHRIPHATCLPQALAAQYLLVKYGYPADLQIGVARGSTGALEAHAWVVTENQFLVGDVRDSDRFIPLSNEAGTAITKFDTPRKVSRKGWTPEARLLVLCSRTQVSGEMAAQIRELVQAGIDWESLVSLAYVHQVVPLLYRSLEAAVPAQVPAAVKTELRQQIQVCIQGNLSLTQELVQLMRLLDQHYIPAIPYKGPVLAASVYHDLSVRSFGDLDILIREEDVLRAIDTLISSGYEIIRPNSVTRTREDLRPYWIRKMIHRSPWAYQVVLWNPDRQGIVELHWRLTPRFVFPENPCQLWEELHPVPLGGSNLYTLAPENLLWYLCLHGTKHKWTELRWICDVAELLHAYPALNWQKVCTRAAAFGVERRLYLGLALCKQIMGTTLPPQIEARIAALPSIRKLEKEVMAGLFHRSRKNKVISRIKRITFQLRSLDRTADRVGYFLRLFKRVDSIVTAQRKFIRPFSFLSLSSRLDRT